MGVRGGRAVVVVAKVANCIPVDVLGDVKGERYAAVSNHGGAERKAPGQVVHAGGLELMLDVQAVAAVIEFQVDGILLAEVSVRIALARAVVLVLRPDVIGEHLEMIREAFRQVRNYRMVIAIAEAGCLICRNGQRLVEQCGSNTCNGAIGERICAVEDGPAELVGPINYIIPLPRLFRIVPPRP